MCRYGNWQLFSVNKCCYLSVQSVRNYLIRFLNISAKMNEEILISLVHSYKNLWDLRNQNYYSNVRRENSWLEISRAMRETRKFKTDTTSASSSCSPEENNIYWNHIIHKNIKNNVYQYKYYLYINKSYMLAVVPVLIAWPNNY